MKSDRLKDVIHWAKFSSRNDIFFCLLAPTLRPLVRKCRSARKIPPSGKWPRARVAQRYQDRLITSPPNHAYLKKTLGPSVIYSMPTGRPFGDERRPYTSSFPTHRLARSTLTNRAPVSDRGRQLCTQPEAQQSCRLTS